MNTIHQSLPFFMNYSPISDSDLFEKLKHIKNGRLAQNGSRM